MRHTLTLLLNAKDVLIYVHTLRSRMKCIHYGVTEKYIVIIKPLHMLTGNESSDINIWMLMPAPQFDYHLTQP